MTRLPPLYVLRHGETEWNATGRLQGSFDSPLTAQGRAQAQQQNDTLRHCNLSGFAAISSPQGRALETAKIALAGCGLSVVSHDNLSEIGLGDWAGHDRAELIKMTGARDGFALYDLAPKGEGFAALHARCQAFLNGLEGPSVLITHGITSRMLRLIATGKGLDALRDMQGGQGVVFHVANGVQKRVEMGA